MNRSAKVDERGASPGPERPARFRPHERLRCSQQYQRARSVGTRFRALHMRGQWAANGLNHHRLGLVVQKRFWNAVRRNRVKRLIREAFRTCKMQLPLPYRDIVVIALPGIETLRPKDIAAQLQRTLARENQSAP